jgi:hypothetical protein
MFTSSWNIDLIRGGYSQLDRVSMVERNACSVIYKLILLFEIFKFNQKHQEVCESERILLTNGLYLIGYPVNSLTTIVRNLSVCTIFNTKNIILSETR